MTDNSDLKSHIEYKPLEDIISFAGFRFEQYYSGERMILTPRLERLGYTHIVWSMGEYDSFGPLTRVCQARDGLGRVCWFVYG